MQITEFPDDAESDVFSEIAWGVMRRQWEFGVIYASVWSRVGTDSILWLTYLTKTAMKAKIYFCSIREEKKYPTFDCISDVSWLCFVKKETLRLRHTHKDFNYILSKGRI